MTEFTARISMTCNAAEVAAANEFTAWVGDNIADRDSFVPVQVYEGSPDNPPVFLDTYIISGQYKQDFLAKLATPITEDTRPEWGADLDIALAQAGQAMLTLQIDETTPTPDGLSAKAKAGKIVTPVKGVANGSPEDATPWAADVAQEIGDLVTHGGTTYMCIQSHTTQSDWTPDVVPALYVVIPADAAVWQAGVQYTIGDVVEYNGADYECRQSHTSLVGWEPPNVPALWLPL